MKVLVLTSFILMIQAQEKYRTTLATLDKKYNVIERSELIYTKGKDFTLEVWLGTRSEDIAYLQFTAEGDQLICDLSIKIG